MTEELIRCYRILDLEPGASLEAVRLAYRDLVKVWHPDRFEPGSPIQQRAERRLREINLAYETLRNIAANRSDDSQNDCSEGEEHTYQNHTNVRGRTTSVDPESTSTPVTPATLSGRGTWWWPQVRQNPWLFWPCVILIAIAVSIPLGSVDRITALYLEFAAESGDPDAQTRLAWRYHLGKGVHESPLLSLQWAILAARAGSLEAQRLLGILHWTGRAVPQNYAEAYRLVKDSASRGHAASQYLLGLFCQQGIGVAVDLVEAHMWYTLAAAQQYSGAERERGLLESQLSRSQVAESHRRAAAFVPIR